MPRPELKSHSHVTDYCDSNCDSNWLKSQEEDKKERNFPSGEKLQIKLSLKWFSPTQKIKK